MSRSDAALVDRRESALLALPSVRRFADILARRCREKSWVRTSVASLDRFATLTGENDLEDLLSRAQRDPHVAQAALERFAQVLGAFTRVQIAGLALGPKLWLALNGVPVRWRPLPGRDWAPDVMRNASSTDRLVLLALVGSGLHRAELLRASIGDLGSLDGEGNLISDTEADPLALRFVDVRTKRDHITFFSERAREAFAVDLARRKAGGERPDAAAPLIATAKGRPASTLTVARAARRNAALIEAGNNVNVEMCKKTGAFFRAWGMPGARFGVTPSVHEEAP